MTDNSRHDPEYRALNALSARVGRDPIRTQAAGGNTSLKCDGVMWIKASGMWLADAVERDIMVPVRLDRLLEALAAGDIRADKAVDFVIAERNPDGLRPSVETSVHAVIPFPVVVHIHCVPTIALAVREDAETEIDRRLRSVAGAKWLFVPYVRPGMPLARAIEARMEAGTNVIVLGNHGLVVAADSVAEAGDLLGRVSAAMDAPRRRGASADPAALEKLAEGSPYRLPADPLAHDVATDPASLAIASRGTLYPDHVVFLGPGIVRLDTGTAADIVGRAEAAGLAPPNLLVVPGNGVLLREGVIRGTDELARCLAEVTARIPEGVPLSYLAAEAENQLVNWDAEIYRRKIAAGGRGEE